MDISVTKRDGRKEPLLWEKVNRQLVWAAEGLDVSVSEVELKAKVKLVDGMKTSDIHKELVKTAADLISEKYPDYQYMAARLAIFDVRKKVFGAFNPPTLLQFVRHMVAEGLYDEHLMEDYSKAELHALDKFIDHDRDMDFAYAGVKQLIGKYLVQNRVTGELHETPQFLYMAIGMALFANYPRNTRLQYVREFYDAVSEFEISLPTPIMGGVRTPTRQFSSCFPKGQKVWTKGGTKNIEDVVVGDKVITDAGTFEEVYHTSNKIFEGDKFISLRNSYSIPWDFECTEEHEIVTKKRVSRYSGFDDAKWIRADQIVIGDAVQIPFDNRIETLHYLDVPVPDGYINCDDGFIRKLSTDTRGRSGDYDDKVKPTPNKIPLDKNFMLMLGYFLAEGHINKNSNSFCYTFNKNEVSYHNDIINYFNDLGQHVNEHVTSKNAKTLLIYSKPLKELILSLVGTGFDTKFISDKIMHVEPELQKYLLSGVIRGDGCITKHGMCLAMVNKDLIKQLGDICLRNGLYPNLGMYDASKVESSYSKSLVYTLTFSKRHKNYEFLVDVVNKNLERLGEPPKSDRQTSFYEDGKYYAVVGGIETRNNCNEIVYDLSVRTHPSFTVSGVAVHNCVKIECGDSLDSINASASSIIKYISQRAGIGINAGRIRALGSEIRGGEAVHTGVIPFFKHFQSAVKSCSQGALRGGAATLFYPMWHYEFESMIVLKNNRGVEENRVRHLDYGIQLNKLMYQRLVQGGNITLFSPHEVEGMYDAFFSDQELFEKLYVEAENNPNIRKKTIKAIDAFGMLMQERAGTGRIYIQHVDHCNVNGPFKADLAPVRQSNLCMEISLPTQPLDDINDENGEIALCTLSAFNLGKIKSTKDFERLSVIAVRALDALLDYQNYPIKAAEISTMNRRSLGIGVINFAYFLAKNGVKYSDGSANELVHEYMEAMQFYLIKASMELAKEKGACPKFNETEYADGRMPIDRYKKDVDGVAAPVYKMDWDWLRKEVMTHGIRNSTLSCAMPSETSSQVSNATNGIEPPRGFVSVKQSKDGVLKQVVPELDKYKDQYELLWDIPNNKGYIDLVAIMQKFMDQSLSANTNYVPANYPNNKVPMKLLLKDLAYTYKMGLKTLYYHNTNDGSGDAVMEDSSECSSCKI